IINRLRPKMVARGDMLSVEDVVEILGLKPIGIIPEDEEVLISTNQGEPLVLKGSSPAALAYMDTARRIRGEEVPFRNLEDSQGFLSLIRRLFGDR
ncbi:MAG: septum site-determining protein MinD, partial [Thermus sp.]|nr:septum site-determining protein MinD [Thermus sp.]